MLHHSPRWLLECQLLFLSWSLQKEGTKRYFCVEAILVGKQRKMAQVLWLPTPWETQKFLDLASERPSTAAVAILGMNRCKEISLFLFNYTFK